MPRQKLLTAAAPPQLVRGLQKKREAQKRRGRDFKLKLPRLQDPRGIERRAQRLLRKRMIDLTMFVRELLIPRLPELLATDDSTKPELATPKRDALGEDLAVVINGIKVQFLRELTDAELRAALQNLGLEASDFNLNQINRLYRTVTEIDVFQDEPFLQSQIEAYVEQNVTLIKSAEERYFTEIQNEIFSGARQGLSTKDISARIQKRGDVAKSKADLIARDQVNKLNGQLSKLRQTSIGVEKYIWRTSLDERVRPEHRVREGQIYSWDEPPGDGHPGEPINCRCYAEPILEDLIEGDE